MDFKENPFYILKAKSTDNKKKLITLSEEALLDKEEKEVNNARLILSNPRKRISAECSWFLGEDNKKLDQILDIIKTKDIKKLKSNLSTLSSANLLLYTIQNSNISKQNLFLVSQLINCFENINTKIVLEAINIDREKSNIPPINEPTDLIEELNNLRRVYVKSINKIFENLTIYDYSELLKELIKELYINNDIDFTLLSEIVDRYEILSQEKVNIEEREISSHISALRSYILPEFYIGNMTLGIMTDKLNKSISNWSNLTKPMQINMERRGLVHLQSRNFAMEVRTLVGEISSLDLNLALEMLLKLKNDFIEIRELSDSISNDIKSLTLAGAKINKKKTVSPARAKVNKKKTVSTKKDNSDKINKEAAYAEIEQNIKNIESNIQSKIESRKKIQKKTTWLFIFLFVFFGIPTILFEANVSNTSNEERPSKSYECKPLLLLGYKDSDPEVETRKLKELSLWVKEKESACSTEKDYLLSKLLVLLSEGNIDDAFTLINDLSKKYPNDTKIQRIRKSWGIE